jgi:hypothetical protein
MLWSVCGMEGSDWLEQHHLTSERQKWDRLIARTKDPKKSVNCSFAFNVSPVCVAVSDETFNYALWLKNWTWN